jgi:hypothetical protein
VGRDHEDHDDGHHHERDDDHRDRVHQRRADLALDGLRLFHVGRQPVQQCFQDAGRFARLDEVAVEAVEVHGVLAEGGVQRRARLHVAADVVEQLGDARVGVAAPHDVEGLQQGHARLHHGGHLAREERDVLGLDLLAGAHPALLDLRGQHALAPQGGLDLVLARSAYLAANDLSAAVLALPLKDEILDVPRCCGCHWCRSVAIIRW